MNEHFISFILLLLLLSSCSPTKKLTKGYFGTDKSVGIIIVQNDLKIPANYSPGSANPLAMGVVTAIKAVTKSDLKDKESILQEIVKKEFAYLHDDLKSFLTDLHQSHGVDHKFIDIQLDSLDLQPYSGPYTRITKAKLDYRPIGQQHQVDYLMIFDVESILEVELAGSRHHLTIKPLVLNMVDNSFAFASTFKNSKSVKGNWRKDENFGTVITAIEENIKATMAKMDNKLFDK